LKKVKKVSCLRGTKRMKYKAFKTIVMSSLKFQPGLRVFIKLQPLYLSLWRACPELVSGEIKREDKKIRNLINTHHFTFDLKLFYAHN